ncbi:DUF397 domain-containing protein [Streptomyces sp. NBC_00872]|nr:DUF397 domain-containing protein [Streptomyces sp. NBC_00872]
MSARTTTRRRQLSHLLEANESPDITLQILPFAKGALRWFKSSYSGGNTTECVEAALLVGGVAVRDSKDSGGGGWCLGGDAWGRFLGGVVRGMGG